MCRFRYQKGSGTVPRVEAGHDLVRRVHAEIMDDIADRASSDDYSGRKFATAEANYSLLQRVYGLAQCTPDISNSDCNTCLQKCISTFPTCCNTLQGARIVVPSCYVRYDSVCNGRSVACCMLLSTLVYTTTSDAIAADSSLEEHLSIFLKVEGLIKTMGLENIWKVKPLLSGTDIKEMFHLESGPVVGHMKEKVLRWQLAHPSRTVERCKDWMRKRYSRLLEESSSLFRLFPVT
ncbi:hypothetical protein C3L33_06380, partial [Rhododendron williamsianum]